MKSIETIHEKLEEHYSSPAEVSDNDPFRVLISTVLSQRTRDEKTRKATENLFNELSSPEEIAKAKEEKIRDLIKPAGFYNVKAKRIKKISKDLVEDHGGEVPENLEELLEFKGVGRKTANCVLVYGFKKKAIPVDTHVHRISNRIGLADSEKPEETEEQLREKIPKRMWGEVNRLMVKFGQDICRPTNPKCPKCFLQEHCDYYEKNYGDEE